MGALSDRGIFTGLIVTILAWIACVVCWVVGFIRFCEVGLVSENFKLGHYQRGTTRMASKNPRYELPGEVLAVLECSPNLEPCEEFRHAAIYAFAKHLNERQCQQCIDFFVQADKELKTMKLLTEFKKRNAH